MLTTLRRLLGVLLIATPFFVSAVLMHMLVPIGDELLLLIACIVAAVAMIRGGAWLLDA